MIRIMCLYTLYKNTKINKNSCWQNSQFYMWTYPLQQHKHKHKYSLPKWPVLHVYIPTKTTKTWIQSLFIKITSLTFVHTIYNNTDINTNFLCKNHQSYICTYPLKQHKHKHKGSLQKCPILNVYITYLHV